jgi:hypothetical protein
VVPVNPLAMVFLIRLVAKALSSVNSSSSHRSFRLSPPRAAVPAPRPVPPQARPVLPPRPVLTQQQLRESALNRIRRFRCPGCDAVLSVTRMIGDSSLPPDPRTGLPTGREYWFACAGCLAVVRFEWALGASEPHAARVEAAGSFVARLRERFAAAGEAGTLEAEIAPLLDNPAHSWKLSVPEIFAEVRPWFGATMRLTQPVMIVVRRPNEFSPVPSTLCGLRRFDEAIDPGRVFPTHGRTGGTPEPGGLFGTAPEEVRAPRNGNPAFGPAVDSGRGLLAETRLPLLGFRREGVLLGAPSFFPSSGSPTSFAAPWHLLAREDTGPR